MDEFSNKYVKNQNAYVVNSFNGIHAKVLKHLQELTKAHYNSIYEFLNHKDPNHYPLESPNFVDLSHSDDLPEPEGQVVDYETLFGFFKVHIQCNNDRLFTFVNAPTDEEVMGAMGLNDLHGR